MKTPLKPSTKVTANYQRIFNIRRTNHGNGRYDRITEQARKFARSKQVASIRVAS